MELRQFNFDQQQMKLPENNQNMALESRNSDLYTIPLRLYPIVLPINGNIIYHYKTS